MNWNNARTNYAYIQHESSRIYFDRNQSQISCTKTVIQCNVKTANIIGLKQLFSDILNKLSYLWCYVRNINKLRDDTKFVTNLQIMEEPCIFVLPNEKHLVA